jgi:multicomponent Na+:H+ antiporter subunit C
VLDDEVEVEDADEEISTDFVDTSTQPITVLHHRDHAAIDDDAPVDRGDR